MDRHSEREKVSGIITYLVPDTFSHPPRLRLAMPATKRYPPRARQSNLSRANYTPLQAQIPCRSVPVRLIHLSAPVTLEVHPTDPCSLGRRTE
jgi:hypothetical protein